MILILENKEEISKWLKTEYKINLEQDYDDLQDLKNSVFKNLYKDAKTYLSSTTVNRYKRIINNSGNNRQKYIKQTILSFGKALYNKKCTK